MMTYELRHFTDRALINLLPEDVRRQLKSQYLISADEIRVSFCGVVVGDTGVSVFLPRNSKVPETGSKDSFSIAALFMKAIRRYSEDRSSKLYATNEGDGNIGSKKLGLISDLLEDYCNNGLYSRRKSEGVLNLGKPDWRKTISSQVPFPGVGGPVYLDIYGTRRRYVSDCEIARIHADVIRELDSTFGWMVTGSESSISRDIQNVPVPKGNRDGQIKAINLELNSVFSERDIRLLKLLREYLSNEYGQESSNTVIGMRHFHGMWEHMLDSTLQWNFPVNKLLATPAYRFDDGSVKTAASKGQRTDTVLRRPSTDLFAVVDAKYYGAQGLGSAPGWPDLVKQFFYARALKAYCPTATVSNAFVFPGQGPLKSAHMQKRDSKDMLDIEYPPIRCAYVDPLHLVEAYVSGKKMVDLSEQLFAQNV